VLAARWSIKRALERDQFIEAGMLEAQGSMMGPAILDYTVNHKRVGRDGLHEILGEPYAPYGCYPCRGEDSWIIHCLCRR
jgi:crotonobetainyl-CoA:carnitine CoA-transferase CaiB-like acyl-CoA transferase